LQERFKSAKDISVINILLLNTNWSLICEYLFCYHPKCNPFPKSQ